MNCQSQKHLERINHFAGLYAQKSRNSTGSKQVKYEERKKALYQIKYCILRREISSCETIEKHTINRKLYYCFYYSDASFHVPLDEFSDLDLDIDGEATVSSFEKSVSDLTEKELYQSLQYIQSVYEIDPNSFLSEPIISFAGGTVVVKWDL